MQQTVIPNIHHIPAHVAIIMDGNGRWATQQGLERQYGHREGVESVRHIAEAAARMGVKYLTLYTFSTENWNRPQEEVAALMALLMKTIEEEIFMRNNIRFFVIGEIGKLPPQVQETLNSVMQTTGANTGMCLTLALSYSSRWEITEAVRQIAQEVKDSKLQPDQITAETVSRHLQTNTMPDPDLLIRTGAEQRLSNYLLWQCAYTELYFTDMYWPEFREEAFNQAITEFQNRERRFGRTGEQVSA